jgi:hypothetical protein
LALALPAWENVRSPVVVSVVSSVAGNRVLVSSAMATG